MADVQPWWKSAVCYQVYPRSFAPWDAIVWQSVIDEVHEKLGTSGAWPTWVLSNHDNVPHRTRCGGSLERSWSAAVLLPTLRGTPFLFQWEVAVASTRDGEGRLFVGTLAADQAVLLHARVDGDRAPTP